MVLGWYTPLCFSVNNIFHFRLYIFWRTLLALLVSPVSVISDSVGPGTFFAETCDSFSVFVLSAWSSFVWNLLHIFLMVRKITTLFVQLHITACFQVIAFDAYRNRSTLKAGAVVGLHLTAGFLVGSFYFKASQLFCMTWWTSYRPSWTRWMVAACCRCLWFSLLLLLLLQECLPLFHNPIIEATSEQVPRSRSAYAGQAYV